MFYDLHRMLPLPRSFRTKDVMKASDEDLDNAVEWLEKAGFVGGALVICGLVIEVIIAWYHPPYDSFWDIWGSVVADSVVAIGVVLEVTFSRLGGTRQREIKRRSDEKIAAATERAAKAELETERLRVKTGPRVLTKEQCKKIQTLKGQVSAVNITTSSDAEAMQFARQMARVLISVGIAARICDVRIGTVWTELHIVIPEPVADFSKVPLYKVFHEAGLSVGCSARNLRMLTDLDPNIPVIMVGDKANPFTEPPYAAGLSTRRIL